VTGFASAMKAASACSAISTRRWRRRARTAKSRCHSRFHGPILDQAIADVGAPPLPPYIASKRASDDRDTADYQTMFAVKEGAVAAPTAGLHFTPELESSLKAKGIDLHRVTLHVGAGRSCR